MNQKSIYPKISVDMFLMQGMWASAFLAVMIIVQIVRTAISFFIGNNNFETYFMSTFFAGSIFMLVIGIIATYSLMPHFVGNGVTRKDFFKGASLGAIGLSIAVPIVTYIISLIEKGIVVLTGLPIQYETAFEVDVEADSSFINKLMNLIFSSDLEFSTHWMLIILIFAVNLLTFYLIGWLIGSAFYKHLILGFVAIVVGVFILYIIGHIVAMLLGAPVEIFSKTIDLPISVSILLLVAILFLCFHAIRLLTRRAVIKI